MQRQDRDPYEVLGLEQSATHAEIRAAYLRLAKKHHPDKNPGDKASEWIFKEVGRAYETLQGTSDAGSTRDSASRRERAGQPHARRERQARERQAREQERERRERAEYGRQQDRHEQQARERAKHERKRKHGESTASEHPLLAALAYVLALPDRFDDFFSRDHPLPTALTYAIVVPSAVICFLVLREGNITPSELLGVWLFFAALLASAMRSKSKDMLYWLGVITAVAIGVYWVWSDLPR